MLHSPVIFDGASSVHWPCGKNCFHALQVGNVKPAWGIVSFEPLYALKANAINRADPVLDSITAQLPVTAGASGVDVKHVEFEV